MSPPPPPHSSCDAHDLNELRSRSAVAFARKFHTNLWTSDLPSGLWWSLASRPGNTPAYLLLHRPVACENRALALSQSKPTAGSTRQVTSSRVVASTPAPSTPSVALASCADPGGNPAATLSSVFARTTATRAIRAGSTASTPESHAPP